MSNHKDAITTWAGVGGAIATVLYDALRVYVAGGEWHPELLPAACAMAVCGWFIGKGPDGRKLGG